MHLNIKKMFVLLHLVSLFQLLIQTQPKENLGKAQAENLVNISPYSR